MLRQKYSLTRKEVLYLIIGGIGFSFFIAVCSLVAEYLLGQSYQSDRSLGLTVLTAGGLSVATFLNLKLSRSLSPMSPLKAWLIVPLILLAIYFSGPPPTTLETARMVCLALGSLGVSYWLYSGQRLRTR